MDSVSAPLAGADPGFPVGGGANPPGGRQHMILPNFAKKLHEIEKILYPKSATVWEQQTYPLFSITYSSRSH